VPVANSSTTLVDSVIYSVGSSVGIGTTAPVAKLDIVGMGTTSATSSLIIRDSNRVANVMVLDNGNVGIGSTAPRSILDVNGTITTTPRHLRFTVMSPVAVYGTSTTVCVVPKLEQAITVTNIEVTCDADPATEPTGDLKWADAFIGLANATVINDFDTAAGVRSDNTITSAAVAAGKALYISFDTTPDAAIKSITFDVTYKY
jgi:hypothetical protein